MKTIKLLVIGGILTGFTVLFQIIPVFLSEIFVILTIFSALPVYIMCRLQPLAGISTFFAAAILISIITPHEGLFFLFTNGIIGLSLGICKYYFCKSDTIPVIISSLILTASLSLMNTTLDINAFGVNLPFSILPAIIIIFVFSIVYCFLYLKLANLTYLRLLNLCKPNSIF